MDDEDPQVVPRAEMRQLLPNPPDIEEQERPNEPAQEMQDEPMPLGDPELAEEIVQLMAILPEIPEEIVVPEAGEVQDVREANQPEQPERPGRPEPGSPNPTALQNGVRGRRRRRGGRGLRRGTPNGPRAERYTSFMFCTDGTSSGLVVRHPKGN